MKDHWIVLSLSSGDVYAGKLKTADMSVAADERDMVIEEPCQFMEETGQYHALNYQYLFVPSKEIFSIAVVHNPQLDIRAIPVGESLFSEVENNE